MNDYRPRGPSVGNIIAGIFLILFALCLIFVGGGCTVMLASYAGGLGGAANMLPLLLISLAVLGGGIAAMWFGVRLIAGKYD